MAYEFEYMNKLDALMHRAAEKNAESIRTLAVKMAENIENDHIIHVFGTGHSHMTGIELFARAGGLGNVDALLDPDAVTGFGAQRSCALEKLSGLADIIYDRYVFEKGDMMIITSNSGRNAVPVEMAARCKKEGIYTVAVTNLAQSKAAVSRVPSGLHLYECADLILDTCVAEGDAEMQIGNVKTGAGSTIISMFLLNTAVCEAMKILNGKGIAYPVFQSQNVDGFDNDAIYEKYAGRIKHY